MSEYNYSKDVYDPVTNTWGPEVTTPVTRRKITGRENRKNQKRNHRVGRAKFASYQRLRSLSLANVLRNLETVDAPRSAPVETPSLSSRIKSRVRNFFTRKGN